MHNFHPIEDCRWKIMHDKLKILWWRWARLMLTPSNRPKSHHEQTTVIARITSWRITKASSTTSSLSNAQPRWTKSGDKV